MDKVVVPAYEELHSGRNRDKKPLKKKKKDRRRDLAIKLTIGGIAGALILGTGIYCIVDRTKDRDSMGCRITVCGENVSWLSVEEAADKIQESFQNTDVVFNENGKAIYTVSLKDAGYSLNREKLISELTKIKSERQPCHMIFEKNKSFEIGYQVERDADKAETAFANDKMKSDKERVASKDAEISYNESNKHFEIIPSELGTIIDNSNLMERIQDTLTKSFEKDLLAEDIDVTIDEAMYKVPDITEDQEKINEDLKINNQKIDHYASSAVTYTFGDVTEELTNDMIHEWIQIDGGNITLNEDAIRDYITGLGEDYNTQYVPRQFTTSYGETITIENNEYGYWIDSDGEYNQLIADIESGEPVTREPVYSAVGWKRNGNDDLIGGYVEVNLTDQRVWLYVDGEEIFVTDCVTGQPEGTNPVTGMPEDRSTYEGTYPISYKEHPAVLSSDIYGYEQEVEYWMPFVYGQGLHDAGWRASFGGNIYMWDGSHGCINLPTYEASVIYSYVDTNFPVIIYKTADNTNSYYDSSYYGYDTTGLYGYDTTGQYGYDTTGQYGYDTTGQYGYDTTGQYNYGTTDTTGVYGYDTTNQYGYDSTYGYDTSTYGDTTGTMGY